MDLGDIGTIAITPWIMVYNFIFAGKILKYCISENFPSALFLREPFMYKKNNTRADIDIIQYQYQYIVNWVLQKWKKKVCLLYLSLFPKLDYNFH